MKRIALITMGCSKNLVDSERLMRMFADAGFAVDHDPDNLEGYDEAIVNTCGFIGDAKAESIDMILRLVKAKNQGQIGHINVMGCLSERYKNELTTEIPEIDRMHGKFDWAKLVREIAGAHPATAPYDRAVTGAGHHAYIKISEGCNRFCSFCAIPLITGRHHSRPADEIVAEVRNLAQKGVREFNIIAQDLSSYGLDIDGRHQLPGLIERLADVPGAEWIRLHYAYPADFPIDVMRVMAERPNVCKYLDIALQHIDDRVLSNMRRHITAAQTIELLQRMRQIVPDLHIRTTLMVGFPGEDDAAFANLLRFVEQQRFERMGAFAYSPEEGTYGYKMFADEIADEVKQQRLDQLMALQEQISLEHQQTKVATTQRVICDGREGDYYVCRTQFDSPEVDPVVLVDANGEPMHRGQFYDVAVDKALPFELIAHKLTD